MGRKTKQKQLRIAAKQAQLKELHSQHNFQNEKKFKIFIFLFTLGIVALTIFSLIFAIFHPGLPSGHDIIAHAYRTKIFIDALREGQFPVRWIDISLGNFNGPFFNFYQVGFYYLVWAVNTIIPSIYNSIKIVVLFSWWMGALFMFLYARRFGTLPAALSALIYAFTPYLISDFFVRASFPETLAIAFSLAILWAFDRLLLTGKAIYGAPLTLCLAGLSLTHLPTVVIMAPVLTGYFFLLLFTKEINFKAILPLAISLMLGLGMAAFYLLPSIFELNLIKSQLLTSDYYDFHPHFVYFQQLFSSNWDYGISEPGPNDQMSFQVGIIQWIIIALSLGLTLYSFKKKQKNILYFVFWLLAIFFSLFFITEISLAFWENISIISFIQYPWRFLMIIPIAAAALGALLLNKISNIWHQALIIVFVSVSIFIFYGSYLKPATFLSDDFFKFESGGWTTSEASKYAVLEEGYLPKTVEIEPQGEVKKWVIAYGQGEIIEKYMRTTDKIFSSSSQQAIVFVLTDHYYPGWKAYIDDKETTIETIPGYGFMQIRVPSGMHTLEFMFTNTPLRQTANVISLLSIISFAVWQLFIYKSNR